MSRVSRWCWVRRPLHRYKYLPRSTVRQPYNYEENAAGPYDYWDKPQEASKLFLVWVQTDKSATWRAKAMLRKLDAVFGEGWKSGDRFVFINSPSEVKKLWSVKQYISVRPLTFPNGEPELSDVLNTEVNLKGECIIRKSGMPNEEHLTTVADEAEAEAKLTAKRELENNEIQQKRINAVKRFLYTKKNKNPLSTRYFANDSYHRYAWGYEVNEDAPHTPKGDSRW